MKKKNNILEVLNGNSINKNFSENIEFKNFIKKKKIENKRDLTFSATFNLIFFFSKYRELGNLNNKLYEGFFFKNLKFNNFNLKKNKTKKKLFFSNKLYEGFFFLKKFFYFVFLYKFNNFNLKKNKTKKKLFSITRNIKFLDKELIKGFLFIGSTKNNFFVTILDYTGNTLITRTGGNTGRTGTRQGSTVFSADNAMYECCFLAKEGGIQSLIVHIKSSLRLQQIKHCFEGLTISGLNIEYIIYGPIKSFGGCRLKKPRRV